MEIPLSHNSSLRQKGLSAVMPRIDDMADDAAFPHGIVRHPARSAQPSLIRSLMSRVSFSCQTTVKKLPFYRSRLLKRSVKAPLKVIALSGLVALTD